MEPIISSGQVLCSLVKPNIVFLVFYSVIIKSSQEGSVGMVSLR